MPFNTLAALEVLICSGATITADDEALYHIVTGDGEFTDEYFCEVIMKAFCASEFGFQKICEPYKKDRVNG